MKDVKKNGIETEKFSKGQNEAGKKLIEKETVQTGNVIIYYKNNYYNTFKDKIVELNRLKNRFIWST